MGHFEKLGTVIGSLLRFQLLRISIQLEYAKRQYRKSIVHRIMKMHYF